MKKWLRLIIPQMAVFVFMLGVRYLYDNTNQEGHNGNFLGGFFIINLFLMGCSLLFMLLAELPTSEESDALVTGDAFAPGDIAAFTTMASFLTMVTSIAVAIAGSDISLLTFTIVLAVWFTLALGVGLFTATMANKDYGYHLPTVSVQLSFLLIQGLTIFFVML